MILIKMKTIFFLNVRYLFISMLVIFLLLSLMTYRDGIIFALLSIISDKILDQVVQVIKFSVDFLKLQLTRKMFFFFCNSKRNRIISTLLRFLICLKLFKSLQEHVFSVSILTVKFLKLRYKSSAGSREPEVFF